MSSLYWNCLFSNKLSFEIYAFLKRTMPVTNNLCKYLYKVTSRPMKMMTVVRINVMHNVTINFGVICCKRVCFSSFLSDKRFVNHLFLYEFFKTITNLCNWQKYWIHKTINISNSLKMNQLTDSLYQSTSWLTDVVLAGTREPLKTTWIARRLLDRQGQWSSFFFFVLPF